MGAYTQERDIILDFEAMIKKKLYISGYDEIYIETHLKSFNTLSYNCWTRILNLKMQVINLTENREYFPVASISVDIVREDIVCPFYLYIFLYEMKIMNTLLKIFP